MDGVSYYSNQLLLESVSCMRVRGNQILASFDAVIEGQQE
jgi:hypothetical protein